MSETLSDHSDNIEIGEFNTAKNRPEWGRPLKCDAKVTRTTIQKGRSSEVYDLNGRRHILPGVVDQPEIIDTSIVCASCSLSTSFRRTGMGYSAYNQSQVTTEQILQQCPKLIALGGYTQGNIPKGKLPS